MNAMRRFGVLTTLAGAALILGSVVSTPSADAAVAQNWTDHDGNITVCPTGSQFDGSIHTGSGATGLFHWTVVDDTYVTITEIDPTVTGLTAYVKGGDGYRVYVPVVSGQPMSAPLNGGSNVPALSHWMLCWTITEATTTTAEVTTTTSEVTTTTVEVTTTTAEVTTTTAEVTTTTAEVTTTTAEATTTTVDSGGPTTTSVITTTTDVDSGGPTTTVAPEAGGPTTTVADVLPRTGAGSNALLVLGTMMLLGGCALTIGTRAPRRN